MSYFLGAKLCNGVLEAMTALAVEQGLTVEQWCKANPFDAYRWLMVGKVNTSRKEFLPCLLELVVWR